MYIGAMHSINYQIWPAFVSSVASLVAYIFAIVVNVGIHRFFKKLCSRTRKARPKLARLRKIQLLNDPQVAATSSIASLLMS
jgi:hypothetical protein